MKKKELTPEEIQKKQALQTHNRRYAGFIRTLKSECRDFGLRSVKLKLEFLESHPTTKLPKSYFNYDQTVACFRKAIQDYELSIS